MCLFCLNVSENLMVDVTPTRQKTIADSCPAQRDNSTLLLIFVRVCMPCFFPQPQQGCGRRGVRHTNNINQSC